MIRLQREDLTSLPFYDPSYLSYRAYFMNVDRKQGAKIEMKDIARRTLFDHRQTED